MSSIRLDFLKIKRFLEFQKTLNFNDFTYLKEKSFWRHTIDRLVFDLHFLMTQCYTFKGYNLQFSVVIALCSRHHNFRTYPSSKAVTPHFLPNFREPLIHFLALWICPFWIFHLNEIILLFCDCLLSLSRFSRFIPMVACISTFFLWPNKFSLFAYPTFIYPFIN